MRRKRERFSRCLTASSRRFSQNWSRALALCDFETLFPRPDPTIVGSVHISFRATAYKYNKVVPVVGQYTAAPLRRLALDVHRSNEQPCEAWEVTCNKKSKQLQGKGVL